MDSSVSKTASNASDDFTDDSSDDFTARDEFLGKNRSLRPSDRSETDSEVDSEVDSEFGDEADAEVCLDHVVWSKLPEELLMHIFARLPVKSIHRILSLSKSWRSIITSPQFQQAFSEASLVRICLLHRNDSRDTIFFSQTNKEESYRPSYEQPFAETVLKEPFDIVGTASGLICVIRYEKEDLEIFVMNVVTGISRELPSPRIKTEQPTLVQMKANVNNGYTIRFIYTKNREDLQVTSWQVYDSVKNVWSKDEGRAIADFKDVEIFNMSTSLVAEQYDVPATFVKETKAVSVFNRHERDEKFYPGYYSLNPKGHVHNVSEELYKLCTHEGRHGVWRLSCSSKWEMVCECPDLEGVWTCLCVMNDLVVLIIELPMPYKITKYFGRKRCAHGGIVKVFHMPTKVWYSFPEDEHFTTGFGFDNVHGVYYPCPILVEIQFDSVP